MKSLIKVLFFYLLLSNTLAAQVEKDSFVSQSNAAFYEFKHAVNFCPVAALIGFYSINYEYRISPKNGIIARFDYEDVPEVYTDASIESSGVSFIVNYRSYMSEELNSLFLGIHTRYRVYKGHGEIDSKKFDLNLRSYSIGLNVGKRWTWNNGFNTVFLLGYGYDFNDRNVKPTNTAIKSVVDQFEEEYEFMSPFFGELSIGYAF